MITIENKFIAKCLLDEPSLAGQINRLQISEFKDPDLKHKYYRQVTTNRLLYRTMLFNFETYEEGELLKTYLNKYYNQIKQHTPTFQIKLVKKNAACDNFVYLKPGRLVTFMCGDITCQCLNLAALTPNLSDVLNYSFQLKHEPDFDTPGTKNTPAFALMPHIFYEVEDLYSDILTLKPLPYT